MRIVLAGSSGFIGRALRGALEGAGHEIVRLQRPNGPSADGDPAAWDPANGTLDPAVLEGADAVVNLAGANISERRWTRRVKRELWESRTSATATIVQALSRCDAPPRVLVNASAVGFYGSRGDRELDEGASRGEGFLPRLTEAWETEARRAEESGARVALPRLGMVVGDGGAVATMLRPFRLGLGGRLGSGLQWWPWVAMDDVVGALMFALGEEALAGPFNVVAPEPATCTQFVKALGRTLSRPALAPAPAAAVRLLLGEMADELLLASTRAVPGALLAAGYRFRRPGLDDALAEATKTA